MVPKAMNFQFVAWFSSNPELGPLAWEQAAR